MKGLFCILLFICSCQGIVLGQETDTTGAGVEEHLEQALEDFNPAETERNTEQLSQFLQELAANPVNINTATWEKLMEIPGLNLTQSQAIIDYRETIKPFETVKELEEVTGIGAVTVEQVYPYVTIGRGSELVGLYMDPRYWTSDGRFDMFSRYQRTFQKREGYRRPDSTGYLGSPIKYYQRIRYRSNHISANLTQEKDAGEPLPGPTGFDYNSWHIALTDNGKLRTAVVGDYNLAFGQGLVLWNGGAFGKGRSVVSSVSKNERGIKPYTSSREANYFRGVAATYGGRLQATVFYSSQSRSASVFNGDTTRFPTDDGMHRTLTEIAKKGNLDQVMTGGRLRVKWPFGLIGATGYYTSFDDPVYAGSAIYNKYDFRGRNTAALGLDYKFLWGSTVLFGEVARTQNGGYGGIAGVESPLGEATDLVLAYRNYQKNFQSIYGSGFGEQSGEPQNERGIYIGLQHELTPDILLRAYFDQFYFPAPRFGTHQPTQGYDWLGVLNVELNEEVQFYIQGRSEVEEDEYENLDPFGRTRRRLGRSLRSSLRAQLQYWVNSSVRLRTRGEIVRSRIAGSSVETGYLLYQDIRYVPSKHWTIDARISMFQTDSYDSRVYQFENDLLYVFSSTVLYKQGQRLYAVLNYEPLDEIEIWAKFGITIFENEQVIGSGLNEIQGNKRSELGVQIRFAF